MKKNRVAQVAGLCVVIAWLVAGSAAPALASCHHFSVAAAPSSVTEGGKVVVTVSRDGNYAPSSIDLSTIDETAKAGIDYAAIHQKVSFTTDVQKQYTLMTLDDHGTESSQTFRLHLSNPSGCFGSGYVVDPDVRVTIKDSTPAPTPTHSRVKPTATPTATAKPTVVPVSPTPTSSAKPSPRVSHAGSTTPSPTPSRVVAAGSSSGGRGTAIGLTAGLIVVVAVAGTLVFRKRRTVP